MILVLKKLRRRKLEQKLKKEKRLLKKYVDIMPTSYKKFLASYYPDAFVRKIYLEDMGVQFQEKSFVNIGFVKIPNTRSENKVIIGKNV